MRTKRLTMLMLSALLSLSTVAFTAPAVSADEGHPNIVVQAVIALEDIDAAGGYYKKANLSIELMQDIRHWVNNHGTGATGVPPFVTAIGGTNVRSQVQRLAAGNPQPGPRRLPLLPRPGHQVAGVPVQGSPRRPRPADAGLRSHRRPAGRCPEGLPQLHLRQHADAVAPASLLAPPW